MLDGLDELCLNSLWVTMFPGLQDTLQLPGRCC